MFLYVHKYPPARPSEANFALPEPARSPKSQKKPGSSPPEARKLEARTSLDQNPNTIFCYQAKFFICFYTYYEGNYWPKKLLNYLHFVSFLTKAHFKKMPCI